ncbi:hypothetical protein EVG80_15200 [Salmonella enterica subsp. enterica serovar Mississippi]|nr:hypothetical protein [Salmonella enterica subsp. enterica serovar Mississippi]
MEHQAQYDELVSQALIAYGRPTSYYAKRKGFEIHHVIPCCAFPHGRDDARANEPSNLVYFTVEEHAQAHYLLSLIYPQNRGLQFAWNNMKGRVAAQAEEVPFYERKYGYSYCEWMQSDERVEHILARAENKSSWEYNTLLNIEIDEEDNDAMNRAAIIFKSRQAVDADFERSPFTFVNENKNGFSLPETEADLRVTAAPRKRGITPAAICGIAAFLVGCTVLFNMFG